VIGSTLIFFALGQAFAPFGADRLHVELEIYAQGRWTPRSGEDLAELALDRGELGATVGLLPGTAAAELRVEAIRSAGEGGALGIDGDTTVIRVKRAQVLASHTFGGGLIVDGAIGFAADPWIAFLEDGYTVKALSRTGSERLLAWSTSDLAAVGRVAYGPARLAVSVGNGEGLQFPERNNGKTTTAVAEVVAVRDAGWRVVVAGVGRDGSIGPALVRDRRLGVGTSVMTPYARGGGEIVQAWGLGDVGEVEGLLVSGWVDVPIVDRWFAAARASTFGFENGSRGRISTFGGAIGAMPGGPQLGLRVWLAVDRTTTSGTAMAVVGGDGGDATTFLVIASAIAPFVME
jgi:hypothetical protein